MRFAGAAWLRSNYPSIELSPFGEEVAEILGYFYKGLYHADPRSLKGRTRKGSLREKPDPDWSDERCIDITVHDTLATFDWDRMTVLCVLAHDLAIRIEVRPHNMQTLRLIFHKRARDVAEYTQRHPTIEEAIERVRKEWAEPRA
jgi:hypothetical protein